MKHPLMVHQAPILYPERYGDQFQRKLKSQDPARLDTGFVYLILCHFSFRVSNYMICRNKVDYTFFICLPVHFLPVI